MAERTAARVRPAGPGGSASPRRQATLLAGLALVSYGTGEALALTTSAPTTQDAFLLVLGVGFAVVGVLIAISPNGNRLAWLYLGVALAVGLSTLAQGLAVACLADGRGCRDVGEVAATLQSGAWIAWVLVPATFLLLLFPDGRLLSPRWRVVAWCAAIGVAGQYVVSVLRSGPLEDRPDVINPIGLSWISALEPVTLLLAGVAVVASAVSLVRRFRGSGGLQRQQIKWLAFVGAAVAPIMVIAVGAYDVLGATVANTVIQFAVLAVPLAAGLAILRYRLYDVDLVVNRTLVYGTLTAILALAYVGTVLVLQLVLGGVTQGSNLAVAGSTLAVAALFRPVRARIQSWVDRRFYRERYDTTRTIAAFSGRLREQLDLETLTVDLAAVVRDTMHPTHVAVWLSPTRVRP